MLLKTVCTLKWLWFHGLTNASYGTARLARVQPGPCFSWEHTSLGCSASPELELAAVNHSHVIVATLLFLM